MFNKTYFVLSPSYHGATLLAKLLNAHPEVTTLGDTMPSNRFDQICGCGERVSQCPFWRAVKTDTKADRYTGRTRTMLPQYPRESGRVLGRLAYSDFTSFWATPGLLKRLHAKGALSGFREDFESFLKTVYQHTPQPGSIFVDGVKFISRVEALAAAAMPIDGIVHLYRDPVDFVASSMRNTAQGGWHGVVEHSLRYRLYHARARQAECHAKKSMALRYEGLADDIDGELARLFRFFDVEPMTAEQLRPYFGQEWHFMGNASLFEFDGVIRHSRHELSKVRESLVRRIAGGNRERDL